jgi:hypothetical protein
MPSLAQDVLDRDRRLGRSTAARRHRKASRIHASEDCPRASGPCLTPVIPVTRSVAGFKPCATSCRAVLRPAALVLNAGSHRQNKINENSQEQETHDQPRRAGQSRDEVAENSQPNENCHTEESSDPGPCEIKANSVNKNNANSVNYPTAPALGASGVRCGQPAGRRQGRCLRWRRKCALLKTSVCAGVVGGARLS